MSGLPAVLAILAFVVLSRTAEKANMNFFVFVPALVIGGMSFWVFGQLIWTVLIQPLFTGGFH